MRQGCKDFANVTLRCVLPLKIAAAQKSGIWVDGESKFYDDGQWIIYDDSRKNTYYNKHKRKDTHLLVVDVDRPANLPQGISVNTNKSLF